MTASGMINLASENLPDCQPPPAKKQIGKKKGRPLQRPCGNWNVWFTLKLQAQAKLQYAWSTAAEAGVALGHVGSLGDEACGTGICVDRAIRINAGCYHVSRQGEVGMIEDVEKFGAKLQRQGFGQFCILRDGEVRIPKTGSVNLVASQIAEIAGGLLERGRIQVARRRRPIRQNRIHARNEVGPLVIVESAARVDADGPPGLHGDNRVQLPAVRKALGKSRKGWKLVVEYGGPAMARVKCRGALFRRKII